jgi:putative mRNA 3-end processing factor
MKLSYQHANPYSGNESFLLRFRDGARAASTNVLVDAGDGVDVESMLESGEYLDAVLVTHAHLDHYRSLPDNVVHEATVYVSPGTGAVLAHALREAGRHCGVGDAGPAVDALEPIEEWTAVSGDVDVRPVPAGHAPGAAGFLLRFTDRGETHRVLATGDFTRRPAGGYRGFSLALPDVDAVFLTAATDEQFAAALTESVGTALQRALGGSAVVLTASGLTAVQYAYLLGHAQAHLDRSVPVELLGHAAKLYEALGYDVPGVRTVPEYDPDDQGVAAGGITITGPEVPVDGGAAALFEQVADDPTATLVQVTGGGTDPVSEAACDVHHVAVSNHPSRETVDEVVEAVAPMQVVVEHQSGRAADRFTDDYPSFVWATDDAAEYTLYEDGRWRAPPWVTRDGERRIRMRNRRTDVPADGYGTPPPVGRAEDPDLPAEGLDAEVLAGYLSEPAENDRDRPDGPGTDRAEGVADGGEDGGSDHGEETPAAGPGAANGAPAVGTDDADASGSATAGDPAAPEAGAPDPAPAGGTDSDPADGTADVQAVLDRLDDIEAALGSDGVQARVVDAGDDVTLLRLLSDADLEHGDVVTVRVDR